MKIPLLTHKKKCRILYLFPQETGHSHNAIYTYFLRISNYLNSRKKDFSFEIKEIYLDLRFEDLPSFQFQNLDLYLNGLKTLLNKIYIEFPFDIVAISCYSSYEYLNSIAVATQIKFHINPKAKIIVGGYHPTIFPEDFQINNLPSFIYKDYPVNLSPFDFLIKGEGELTFLKLVKHLLNNDLKLEMEKNCLILEGETLTSLDDLPIIDLKLFQRYKDIIKNKRLNIDFGRGCMFHCKICLPGASPCFHKNMRVRSINKCIEELKLIKNTKWLKVKSIAISDPVFFPKRKERNEFYDKFRDLIRSEGFPYKISIYDRVDICSKHDLVNYKELNITPYFGFESPSIPMLKSLNKINSKNERAYINYKKKMEDLIIISNELDLNIWMFLIIGLPGESREVIRENRKFFLEKRFNGKSLSEKYKIILDVRFYKAIPGSTIYKNCEEKYGSQIHYKNWWRLPLEDHRVYNKVVDPSKELDFLDSLKLNYEWIKEFVSFQIKNNTQFFDKGDFKILREGYFKFSHLFKNGKASYHSFIPESWKSGMIYP